MFEYSCGLVVDWLYTTSCRMLFECCGLARLMDLLYIFVVDFVVYILLCNKSTTIIEQVEFGPYLFRNAAIQRQGF